MIQDEPGMLRQSASIVYSDSCIGGYRIMREVSAYRYSSGVSWQSGSAGEGDWTMAIRMAHFGLCVLLELYIQLKPKLAPGFSLETPTLSKPHCPPTFIVNLSTRGTGPQKRNFQETTKLFRQWPHAVSPAVRFEHKACSIDYISMSWDRGWPWVCWSTQESCAEHVRSLSLVCSETLSVENEGGHLQEWAVGLGSRSGRPKTEPV